jgi:Domain of unknown function (DUF4372)
MGIYCASDRLLLRAATLIHSSGYRESLRDIEACLSAQTAKLYHMGLREPVRCSTLADANEARDWRIYAEFAQRLIAQARRLYASESPGVDLTNIVHALDSTTIDLYMSMFPRAFPVHQVRREDAYPARSARQYFELHPYLERQAARCSCAGHADSRTRRHLRDGPRLYRLRPSPYAAPGWCLLRHARPFFVTRAKSNLGPSSGIPAASPLEPWPASPTVSISCSPIEPPM